MHAYRLQGLRGPRDVNLNVHLGQTPRRDETEDQRGPAGNLGKNAGAKETAETDEGARGCWQKRWHRQA